MKKIVVVGEILAEIVADTKGSGFLEPIAFTGPYPSGAPAIFVDQAAKLGQPCAIISAVGRDDFGRINLERLSSDGVDVSAVRLDDDRPTGMAFVRYRRNGSREFVFNIRHSACGLLIQTDAVQTSLADADHFHVMGSSLSNPEFVALNVDTALAVKKRGGTVSFDPNLRKEFLGTPGLHAAMMQILTVTDLFLPSGDELALLFNAINDADAVQELRDMGVSAIVHKLGSAGVQFYDGNHDIFVPAFTVEEVDPTGAGDCFGGTFTTLWLRGADIVEALTLATAAGALAVTKRGPMEGTSNIETLRRFIRAQRKSAQRKAS